jgi:serine protease AprX
MGKSRQFNKVTFAVFAVLILAGAALSQPESDINAKVTKLDIGKSTLDDVISIFGEPTRYFHGGETFTKDNLPQAYIAQYPNEFSVVMASDRVEELRFESQAAGYVFRDKIRVGSLLNEALKVIGQPKKTVVGKPNEYEDGVLYKDIGGEKGSCYYGRRDRGIRLFFFNYKVTALYLTSTEQVGSSETAKASKDRPLQKVGPVESVKEFDDVRNKDLSGLDLSKAKRLIRTLQFNRKTKWPAPEKMPASIDPNQLLTDGMNPGLGIRKLHREGITGKGVNVAIIDQPLYQDHPEFAGKIAAYHDVGCGSETSMHGPAVTSLLVGTNCGTAPDARVYYVAAPSWTKDTAYEAQALDWIVEQNERLPVSEKIRVVSVSGAPSGPATVFEKNQDMWDPACARAEAAGILVLDCTRHHGFIERCWYNPKVPESVAGCTPGHPKEGVYFSNDKILAPAWGRTIAEESSKGDFGYIYGRGGVSWSVPYCAGVLALGWQLRPDIPPEQMRELLFKSAYVKKDGAKIINPEKFIQLVKKAK